jgi:hypothetical protein
MWDRGGGDRASFGLHEQAESLLRREALPRLRESRSMSEGSDCMWCWLALGARGATLGGYSGGGSQRSRVARGLERGEGELAVGAHRTAGADAGAGAGSIASLPYPWMKILPEPTITSCALN